MDKSSESHYFPKINEIINPNYSPVNRSHCAFYLPKLLLSKSAYFKKKFKKPQRRPSFKDYFEQYSLEHSDMNLQNKYPKIEQNGFIKYVNKDTLVSSQSTPHLKNLDQFQNNNPNIEIQKIYPVVSPKLFQKSEFSDSENILDASRDLLDKLTNIDKILDKIQWEQNNLLEQKKEEYFMRKYKDLIKHLNQEKQKHLYNQQEQEQIFKKITSKIINLNKLQSKLNFRPQQQNYEQKPRELGVQDQNTNQNQQSPVKKRILSRAEILKLLRPKNKNLKNMKFTTYQPKEEKPRTPAISHEQEVLRRSSSGYKINFLDLAFMFAKISKSLHEYKTIIEQNIHQIQEEQIEDEEAHVYIAQYQERLQQIDDVQKDWMYLKTFFREEGEPFIIKLRQNEQEDNLKFMDNKGFQRPIMDLKKVADYDFNQEERIHPDFQERKKIFEQQSVQIRQIKQNLQKNQVIMQIGLEQNKQKQEFKKRKTIQLHGLIFDMEESSSEEQQFKTKYESESDSTFQLDKKNRNNIWIAKLKNFQRKLQKVNISKLQKTQQQLLDIKKKSEWLIQNEILQY